MKTKITDLYKVFFNKQDDDQQLSEQDQLQIDFCQFIIDNLSDLLWNPFPLDRPERAGDYIVQLDDGKVTCDMWLQSRWLRYTGRVKQFQNMPKKKEDIV